MRGLNLESLAGLSERLGGRDNLDELRKCFEALEREGTVFRAVDEISGKEFWFPIQELDRKTDS